MALSNITTDVGPYHSLVALRIIGL